MAAAPVAAVPGLVHDYLLVLRGAERTFAEIADCFPQAPIYTLLYDPPAVASRFAGRTVRTSALQRLHVRQPGFRTLLPLMPSAAERLPVQGHELVVSSSSAFAHGVRPGEGAVHVCYCHTPFRYAWHERRRALDEVNVHLRPALSRVLSRARRWDLEASSRVTRYIANSEICRRRIDELWHRDASVVHPPVETHRFHIGEPEDFFLVVAELVPHKRVDTALEAARRAGRPIKVVGSGPDRQRLAARYADTAQFLGRISDSELEELYPRARALMVPNVEEFGITAVEAQASGRPVVASAAGGARETVIDGTTGVLVPPGDVDAFADAIRNTNFEAFSPHRIKRYAERFSTRVFRRKFLSEVAGAAGREVSSHAGIGEAWPPALRAT
jgi:glycosyltransferase involved in cell wall biosynthesis